MSLAPQVAHRSLWSLDSLSGLDLTTLLETAHAVAVGGVPRWPLRGKRLVVLRERPDDGGATALQRAADALGMKVTTVPPPTDFDGEARLLGRLYDAIDCVEMDEALVRRIETASAVPVYNGLAGRHFPTRVLGTLLGLVESCRKPPRGLQLACVDDTRKPLVAGVLQAAALAGMDIRIAKASRPSAKLLRKLQATARDSGAQVRVLDPAVEAAAGADAVLRPGAAPDDAQAGNDDVCMLQAMMLTTLT